MLQLGKTKRCDRIIEIIIMSADNAGFRYERLNGCTLKIEYTSKILIIFSIVTDKAVAMAAPNIPYWGIKNKFKMMFNIKVLRSLYKFNIGFPIILIIAVHGPVNDAKIRA